MGREELHVGDDDERLGQEQRGDPVVAFISGVSLLPRIATAAHFIVLGLLLVDPGGTLRSWTQGWRTGLFGLGGPEWLRIGRVIQRACRVFANHMSHSLQVT